MQTPLLNQIQDHPSDLKRLSLADLDALAYEIRWKMLQYPQLKWGHIEASLGVVELTLALHYVLNTPHSPLIWDVGHQCYAHKMITGRLVDMTNLRHTNGLSGFPKRSESLFDAFGTGHSSTSISAAMGMATNTPHHLPCIAVIGDASLASGMAMEALNHLADTQLNVWVVINDNNQGIDPSIGGLKHHLNALSNGHSNASNVFENLRLSYVGPIDGHNIQDMVDAFTSGLETAGPKCIHVRTRKGELNPNQSIPQHYTTSSKNDYQDVVGNALIELRQQNSSIKVITPAMITGSGLSNFQNQFPHDLMDVGIAEQHALGMAAGMAAVGLRPFVIVYSTFLQRAMDQLIHDIALQNLPVVIGIDRAGLVGQDGETHQGVFDIALCASVPNLILANARNARQLEALFRLAAQTVSPFLIRYPRGQALNPIFPVSPEISIGQVDSLNEGSKAAILFVGDFESIMAKLVYDKMPDLGVYHFAFIQPLNRVELERIAQKYSTIITLEDAVVTGGFGSMVAQALNDMDHQGRVHHLGVRTDKFIPHAPVDWQYHHCGIDLESIYQKVRFLLGDDIK